MQQKTVALVLSIILISVFSAAQPYQSLFTDATFNAKAIDQSKPVGVIDGAASVTLTGAATYTIPIKCPPGTNGMTPKLAITYSSQAGNGVMGMGWNIEGLSAITRVSKNLYHDGIVQPVTNTWADVFALDGNRLIPANGTGPTHKLEVDNFSTITTFGSGANKWWRVITKDGTEMDYGSTNDSRLMNDLNTEVMAWRLNKIKDVNGNYIDFIYTTHTGSGAGSPKNLLIDKIIYTQNLSAGLTTPYNEIKFNYTTSPFTNTMYEAGSGIVMNRLLASIDIQGENNQLFKTYVFNYGHKNVNLLLKEVIEKDAGGTQLNSTIFKYGDMPDSWNMIDVQAGNVTLPCNQHFPYYFLDLQGDGVKELVKLDGNPVNSEFMINSFRIYQRDQSTGSYNFVSPAVSYGTSKLVKLGDAYARGQFDSHRITDMDGDGREDIVLLELTPDNGYTKVDAIKLFRGMATSPYLAASASLMPSAVWNGNPMANNVCAIKPQHHVAMLTGDFDGDKRTEVLVIFEKNTGGGLVDHYPTIFSYSSSSNTIIQASVTNIDFTLLAQESFKAEVVDVDGDGRSEILLRGQNKSVIYKLYKLSGGVNAGDYVASKVGSDLTWPTSYHNIYPGDFNGDGKTDLLLQWGNGEQWEKGISDGIKFIYNGFSQFLSLPKILNVNTTDIDEKEDIVIGDFDGDGKSDIAQLRGSNTNLVYTYLSRGDDFWPMVTWAMRPTHMDAGVSDINGDGRSDLICRSWNDQSSPFDNQDYPTFFYYFKDKTPYLLHKVKDGFDRITTFAYDPLTKGGTHYTKGTNAGYPLLDIQVPLYTVKSINQPNGTGSYNQINYSYSSAISHLEGRGFLGFKKVSSVNPTTDSKAEQSFDVCPTYYTMRKTEDKTYLASTNQLLSHNTYNITCQPTIAPSFYQKLNVTTEYNGLSGATNTTSNTYNNNGNITQSVVNINNVETITTNTSYTTTANGLEKPSSITIARTRGNATSTDRIAFTYDNLGRLLSKTDNDNKPLKTVTTYGYGNGFGNLTTETIIGTLIPYNVVTSYTYDSKGRFPIKVTNPLGQDATTTWHPLWGKPLEVTEIDNVRTTNTYDSWGKLTSSTTSYWNTIPAYTITYSDGWDLSGAISNAVWYSQATHPGKPDVKVWYDILNRELETESEHYNNEKVYTRKTYNPKGQLSSSTRPRKVSEGFITTSYSYNPYGLLSGTSDVYGTTNYTYTYGNGNTTSTVSSPKGSTTTVTDAAGRILEQTDNGGKLTFTYDSRGNVLAVKQGVFTLIANTYDTYGRKINMNDCDAGVITYTYDAWGRLLSEKDAKNNTHAFTYDKINRITQRSGPEGTTYYTYHSAGNGYGNQLHTITGFNGVNEEYDYDQFGRHVYSKTLIDGKTFETSKYYNYYGDLVQVTHNNRFGYTNTYDQNGFLQDVQTNWYGFPYYSSETVFTTGSINGQGQYTSYTLGNGLTTSKSYNNGFPLNTSTPGIQNLTTNFNIQTGNLSSRWDYLKNLKDDFTYDNLNRLTSATVSTFGAGGNTTFPTFSVTYDQAGTITQGNIIAKTDVGNYQYGGFPRHATKYVTNTPQQISKWKQDITYTPFRKAEKVNETDNQSTYNFEQTFTYDAAYQRVKSVLTENGTTQQTRYYMDGYEYNVNGNEFVYYVPGGDGLCAIIQQCTSIHAPVKDVHYIYTDHLGSIVAATDENGNIEAEQNFDAWGRFRDPGAWHYGVTPHPAGIKEWLYRGYTGHEHMPEFALINMNGRMYDPMLGRMLSPDPYVMPAGSQGYNRFTYALNNPLSYTDPDGEWVNFVIAAVVGGVFNVVANGHNINSFGDGLKYFGIGAAAGLVGGAVGAGVSSAIGGGSFIAGVAGTSTTYATAGISTGATIGLASGATSGAVLGAGNAWANGGNVGDGALQGFIWGGLTGVVTGGVMGGLEAKQMGRNVWDGRAFKEQISPLKSKGMQPLQNDKPAAPASISEGTYKRGQIRSNVDGDLDLAAKEWNKVIEQYSPSKQNIRGSLPYQSFTKILPDGSVVTGKIYFGGTTNPSGYTIKLTTYTPPPANNKVPPVYLRYNAR